MIWEYVCKCTAWVLFHFIMFFQNLFFKSYLLLLVSHAGVIAQARLPTCCSFFIGAFPRPDGGKIWYQRPYFTCSSTLLCLWRLPCWQPLPSLCSQRQQKAAVVQNCHKRRLCIHNSSILYGRLRWIFLRTDYASVHKLGWLFYPPTLK